MTSVLRRVTGFEAAQVSAFGRDMLSGLAAAQKQVPGHWLHDADGAALYAAFTASAAHTAVRSEQLLLQHCGAEIAALAGRRRTLFVSCAAFSRQGPDEALAWLQRAASDADNDALLVLGADATLDARALLALYGDPACAAFNRHLLVRCKRELGADFELDKFEHQARFDVRQRRIELHLVSRCEQQVRLLGRRFALAAGESIHSASFHHHSLLRVQAMASRAGWSQRQLWTDGSARFALHVFERSVRPTAPAPSP